jgi:hypothetical protein
MVKPSKIFTFIRWYVMPASSYADRRRGKKIRTILVIACLLLPAAVPCIVGRGVQHR